MDFTHVSLTGDLFAYCCVLESIDLDKFLDLPYYTTKNMFLFPSNFICVRLIQRYPGINFYKDENIYY